MHGVQGPGGPRWGVAPGRGGSRTFRRDVYVRRRILAVLVVLLLLALLVPRACQALLGSNEDTGPREHRKAGAPETATGAGGGTKGTTKTETKDTASDRGVPLVKESSEDTSGAATTGLTAVVTELTVAPETATGAGGGTQGTTKTETKDTASDRGVPLVKESSEDTSGAATTGLTAMVTELTVIGGDETFAAEDAAGEGPSADVTTQVPAGPSLVGARQTVVAPQNAPETSRAPAQRPPSGAEHAPAHRQVLSSTAIPPVTTPARERIRGRRDLAATVSVAVEPVAVEPVAVEPVAVEPVAVEPVAVEPVPADTAFVGRDTSVGPRGVATNFRGNGVEIGRASCRERV